MKDHDVLDRNLRALLTRSFVPVLPRPLFREQLIAQLLGELDRRSGRRAVGRSRNRGRKLALAAGLLLTFGALWLVNRDPGAIQESSTTLLARGEIALQQSDGTWRAATPKERSTGIEARCVSAVTPDQASAVLRLDLPEAELGLLALAAASRAEFTYARGELAALRLDAGVARLDTPAISLSLVVGETLYLKDLGVTAEPEPELAATVASTDRQELAGNAPAAPASSPSTNQLFVDVFDGDSQERLPTGTLALLPEQQLNRPQEAVSQAFRGAQGQITWKQPIADGRYFVFVRTPDRALYHAGEVVFGPGSRKQSVTARLTAGGGMNGFIVDAETGEPIPDVWIISYRDTPSWGSPFQEIPGIATGLGTQARSRMDGSFDLALLSAGEHVVQTAVPGHAPAWTLIEVHEGDDRRLADIALDRGGTVVGSVTRQDGSPHVGAQIIVYATEGLARDVMAFGYAVTDGEGRYSVPDVPRGPQLIIMPAGNSSDGLPEVKPVEIRTGETSVVDFLGDSTGTTLIGELVHADGTPLGPVNIGCFLSSDREFSKDWKATTTRADGTFVLNDLEPADYLIFTVSEYGTELTLIGEVNVPDVATHRAKIIAGGAEIRGRTIDANPGSEEERGVNALLLFELQKDGHSIFAGMAVTDEDGNYDFSGAPEGLYRITAYPLEEGFGFEDIPAIEVPAGPSPSLDIAFWPGTTATIRAIDADGAPVVGADVSFENADGQDFVFGRSPVTGPDGRHVATGLSPGGFTVHVTAPGFSPASHSIDARAGRPLEIEITLRPTPPSNLEEQR